MTEDLEEDYRKNNISSFCEKEIVSDKVRDHCHLTGKNCDTCNINVKQKDSDLYHLHFIILVITILLCSLRD